MFRHIDKQLIIATRNPGKFREIAAFFADLPLVLKNLKDEPRVGVIQEDGKTFVENALKKAREAWKITGGSATGVGTGPAGGYVLADDSGLVCDDLGGRPGVESARFAGPQATDQENNRQLIEELNEVHDPSRTAHYVCALVLIEPAGKETVVEETCEGVITFEPAGTGGFGYDPYFYVPSHHCTMAELPLEVKNGISHRGKALRKMHDFLKKCL